MRTHNVAVIPGDGIGTEVIGAGKKVLEALAKKNGDFTFNFEEFDWSSQRYLDQGQYIPEGGLEKLATFDAIYFGAVGSQQVPDSKIKKSSSDTLLIVNSQVKTKLTLSLLLMSDDVT